MFASNKPVLNLESLETREVPAVIGWVKGGPQPEPPTRPVSGWTKIDPITLPPTRPIGPAWAKASPMPEPPSKWLGGWVAIDPQPEPPFAGRAWSVRVG